MSKKIMTCFVLTCLFTSPVFAKPVEKQASIEKTAKASVERIFSEAEKVLIEHYFEKNAPETKKKKGKGLPPGLAKKDRLPPGLEKQFERNGRLPPGLEKKRLPDDLLDRLPSCHKKGLECTIVNGDVVLMEAANQLIHDILRNVLR